MNPSLARRLLATETYYKLAEQHTNECEECKARLLEDFFKRWEHMTGKKADRIGSIVDRATRFGLTAGKDTETHTNLCDYCLEISIKGFEERFEHSRIIAKPSTVREPQ